MRSGRYRPGIDLEYIEITLTDINVKLYTVA